MHVYKYTQSESDCQVENVEEFISQLGAQLDDATTTKEYEDIIAEAIEIEKALLNCEAIYKERLEALQHIHDEKRENLQAIYNRITELADKWEDIAKKEERLIALLNEIQTKQNVLETKINELTNRLIDKKAFNNLNTRIANIEQNVAGVQQVLAFLFFANIVIFVVIAYFIRR